MAVMTVRGVFNSWEASATNCFCMTLIMFLNNHLKSRNYGMAGALSVFLFVVSGILCFVVYRMTNGKDDTAVKPAHGAKKKGGAEV